MSEPDGKLEQQIEEIDDGALQELLEEGPEAPEEKLREAVGEGVGRVRYDGAIKYEFTVKLRSQGKRLDQYLVERLGQYSRSLIQRIIKIGAAEVNGRKVRPSYHIKKGDFIRIWVPEITVELPVAENIPLDILYEDPYFVVVNKPPGMVVHPAKGHWRGTLVNALRYHLEKLSEVAGSLRPGIIHRLDRDTSGVIVVAKDDLAHVGLALQFEHRKVYKEYHALVVGEPDRDSDYIEKSLGHHPTHREKMAVRDERDGGKPAQTYYEVIERFRGFSYVKAVPLTGRTHQIRVHLAHIGCPVLADKAYGGRRELRLSELEGRECPLEEDTMLIERQALHAYRLRLRHPITNKEMEFVAPLPDDFARTLEALRKHRSKRKPGP